MPVPIQTAANNNGDVASQQQLHQQHPQHHFQMTRAQAAAAGAGGPAAAAAPQRNRPTMSSRACSYQDTSRYRTSHSATTTPVAEISNPIDRVNADGPVSASSVVSRAANASELPMGQQQQPEKKDGLAGLVGSEVNNNNNNNKPRPFSAASRPVLARGFTREAWVKQLASGGVSQAHTPSATSTPRGGQAPGYFTASAPGGSAKNTPAQELAGAAASVWGPASPSLTGAFTLEHDIIASPQAAENNTTPKQTFAFTVHAARHLSAVSRPGTPTDELGATVPESVTETAERYQEGRDHARATPATGRKLMVAVDGADPDGLATLDWACKNVVEPGDTLTVVRVVRELKGFKGGFAAASDMLRTIEARARSEADRVTCHAIRQLGREGKKAVDIFVKYRVGEPRAAIRELVAADLPRILVVGNSRQRVAAGSLQRTPGPVHGGNQTANIFFHGGHGTFVPESLRGDVEVVTAQ
ncbi:hypothetical protein HDU87_006237 [Geranomyces variabilis]|uniref:UspA domain-containing protein n=1 Tax=Geranomyces variabilis TaxID=109894 RepID=A0AAD5XQQ2_9FUNG|nr:hypothetical protein HDU87_006237 [Geranomyces variabilis]